jgi:plastocyanin
LSAKHRKLRLVLSLFPLFYFAITSVEASAEQANDHSHHSMHIDDTGMVMNNNVDKLPTECNTISEEHAFTVYASVEYAKPFPGNTFGMSQHHYQVQPCSRITVTFINQDEVRHQWMVHGLPSYIYPGGMFHLEASGGHTQTGTFIVPGSDKTYLVHCDMAQHMEKGMKGQLQVGSGDGQLWAIPGVSASFNRDEYSTDVRVDRVTLVAVVTLLIALAVYGISLFRKP